MSANGESEKTHLPALDGLRGLAILLVLSMHLSEDFWYIPLPWRKIMEVFFCGWTGIDLFFVLSGFLITGILWESRSAHHYFRNFYARRTLRLFPLYYTTLIVAFLIIPHIVPLLEHRTAVLSEVAGQLRLSETAAGYWYWYVAYCANILLGTKGLMFPGQFWSLSVEEHFYLVWPLLVYRLSHRTLVKVTGWIIVGTFIVRCCLFHFVIPYGMFCLTPCRTDGLAMGAMIALVMRNENGLETLKRFTRRAGPWILAACAALYLGQKGILHQYGLIQQTIGYTVTPAAFACLLILALTHEPTKRFFSGRLLRFFGKYSYAIYVINPFVIYYIKPLFSRGNVQNYSIVTTTLLGSHAPAIAPAWLLDTLDSSGRVTAVLGTTVLLSMMSWRLIEQPCLKLKKYFPYERRHPASGAELLTALAEGSGANAPEHE